MSYIHDPIKKTTERKETEVDEGGMRVQIKEGADQTRILERLERKTDCKEGRGEKEERKRKETRKWIRESAILHQNSGHVTG
jgi:hypothetical protein